MIANLPASTRIGALMRSPALRVYLRGREPVDVLREGATSFYRELMRELNQLPAATMRTGLETMAAQFGAWVAEYDASERDSGRDSEPGSAD